jgi:hypothetical protein
VVNSRSKGKRGELEARDQVRKHWLAESCIRAGQACGKFASDLLGALPGAHVEVKRYRRIGAFDFYRQAKKDAGADLPVVLMREDGEQTWLVMFAIEDTERLVAALSEQLQRGHTHAQDSSQA